MCVCVCLSVFVCAFISYGCVFISVSLSRNPPLCAHSSVGHICFCLFGHFFSIPPSLQFARAQSNCVHILAQSVFSLSLSLALSLSDSLSLSLSLSLFHSLSLSLPGVCVHRTSTEVQGQRERERPLSGADHRYFELQMGLGLGFRV